MADKLHIHVCDTCNRIKESYINMEGDDCVYCDTGKYIRIFSEGCKN